VEHPAPWIYRPVSERWRGIGCGIGAAALFGVSAPVAKLLLPGTGPFLLAALLYLGAGISLTCVDVARGRRRAPDEARLRRSDLPLLGAITVLGGVIGPVLMLVGLSRVSAVSGALLLNLEAPLTIFIAVLFFRDHLGRRAALAGLLILGGSFLLAWAPGALRAQLIGALALAGACAAWALDNNLTQRLSLRDPVQVVRWKALVAGACNLALGLTVGERLPALPIVAAAMVLGVLSYGLSIVLDTYALRILGAAREAAFFATAPFIGAVVAIPLHHESPTLRLLLAAVLMVFGVWLLIAERHHHLHAHEAQDHDHLHVHDEHHQHEHPAGAPLGEPHAHPHQHAPLVHDHPHTPDLHHRHRH
jgi:drug/metabolite transporter (DMT)-like permease